MDLIRAALKRNGLVGIVLDEYSDIEEQDLTEKMVTFASLSKFVLADDIAPSGHIQELKICQDLRFVTAVLRLGGRSSTMMQADLTGDLKYMKEFAYQAEADLSETVTAAADWARSAIFERSKRLNRLYSDWRSPDNIMR